MICPLMSNQGTWALGNLEEVDCVKERCAWWLEVNGICIVRSLGYICLAIGELKRQMEAKNA